MWKRADSLGRNGCAGASMRAAKSNLATLRRASQGTRSSWSQTISLALIDKNRTASSRDEGWTTAQPDQFGRAGNFRQLTASISEDVSRFPEMNYNKASLRVRIMCKLQRTVSFIKNQFSSEDDKQLFLGFFLAVAFGFAIVIIRRWLS